MDNVLPRELRRTFSWASSCPYRWLWVPARLAINAVAGAAHATSYHTLPRSGLSEPCLHKAADASAAPGSEASAPTANVAS